MNQTCNTSCPTSAKTSQLKNKYVLLCSLYNLNGLQNYVIKFKSQTISVISGKFTVKSILIHMKKKATFESQHLRMWKLSYLCNVNGARHWFTYLRWKCLAFDLEWKSGKFQKYKGKQVHSSLVVSYTLQCIFRQVWGVVYFVLGLTRASIQISIKLHTFLF